jgi:hypothetical protein
LSTCSYPFNTSFLTIKRSLVKIEPLIGIDGDRGVSVSRANNGLVERLLKCEKDLESYQNELKTWTDSLRELSDIEDAFEDYKENKLHGKTILDIGTDCVKPLYIAIKFEPDKIIGINEDLSYSYAPDIEQNSKLFTDTKIRLYNCSFFDKVTLDKILEQEGIGKFDFVLVSKTLHHLRSGECIRKEENRKQEEHKCREYEKSCIYGFEEQKIFERFFKLGERVIIYEFFDPSETDNDKIRGRGGYFPRREWKQIFEYLSNEKYKVKFIRPKKFPLNKDTLNKVYSMLRKVDTVCFYVEK